MHALIYSSMLVYSIVDWAVLCSQNNCYFASFWQLVRQVVCSSFQTTSITSSRPWDLAYQTQNEQWCTNHALASRKVPRTYALYAICADSWILALISIMALCANWQQLKENPSIFSKGGGKLSIQSHEGNRPLKCPHIDCTIKPISFEKQPWIDCTIAST